MGRETVVIIVSEVNGNRAIHFTSGKLQVNDLWFPITQENSLFRGVERVLVTNGIAHNVSFMKLLRVTPTSKDWEVTYNESRVTR
ncbi:hypothetical protein FIU96_12045 [Marinobacter sp. THAF39]|nr:hypothetical protein FIV08_12130 [Marinobacter sp. THAF197a]QFT51356.1 hypothetical protein FIU96_12045 [Marinobacter sp. THAF39]